MAHDIGVRAFNKPFSVPCTREEGKKETFQYGAVVSSCLSALNCRTGDTGKASNLACVRSLHVVGEVQLEKLSDIASHIL